jgi:hypothetical protein
MGMARFKILWRIFRNMYNAYLIPSMSSWFRRRRYKGKQSSMIWVEVGATIEAVLWEGVGVWAGKREGLQWGGAQSQFLGMPEEFHKDYSWVYLGSQSNFAVSEVVIFDSGSWDAYFLVHSGKSCVMLVLIFSPACHPKMVPISLLFKVGWP